MQEIEIHDHARQLLEAHGPRIEAGAAAARKVDHGSKSAPTAWARTNGIAIFRASLSGTGVKPWFRIVRQPKSS